MKNIKLYLVIFLSVICCLNLVSCDKDDEGAQSTELTPENEKEEETEEKEKEESDEDEIVYLSDESIAISSANQLAKIGSDSNYPISGSYTLINDIILSGDWTPIGKYSNAPFKGIFNGDDHIISGLTINSDADYQGLFGYVKDAIIKNVIISEASINCMGEYIGAVVGYADGSSIIDGCSSQGGAIVGNGTVGGVVGYISESSSISNCFNTGLVSSGDFHTGGVVAASAGVISTCYNTGDVTSVSKQVGGVVGSLFNALSISYCYNEGNIEASGSVGGVIGLTENVQSITDCYNMGDVLATTTSMNSGATGGVIGYVHALSVTTAITTCYNEGSVEGGMGLGGVVGYSIGTIKVDYCNNKGDITGSCWGVGGIGGLISGEVTSCYNTGSISSEYGTIGGIVGSGTTIQLCYNTGSVTNTYSATSVANSTYNSSVGGITGSVSSAIISCYNSGSITSDGDTVGGVVGSMTSNTYVIACYNTNEVTGATSVGGIAGYARSNSTITACYNSSSIYGSLCGGILGESNGSYTTTCYFIDQVGDDVSRGVGSSSLTDYDYMTLSSISALNSVVSTMNSTAGDTYFIAGSPADTVLPYLSWEE